MIKSE